MPSTFSTCRTGLQTVARTVAPFSGTTAQVVLGNYDWAAGTNFFANIVTTGPWIFILPVSGSADGQTFNSDFHVNADLIHGFPNDAAYDWTAIDDIKALLIAAWVQASQFVHGAVLGPFGVEFGDPEVRSDLKPVVARTRFAFTFKFVAG